MPKGSGYKDISEHRDHRFLVDEKMRVVDGLSEKDYQKAISDKHWSKKQLTSGRVFLSELPSHDVPNSADRERALREKYLRENPGHRSGVAKYVKQHLGKPGINLSGK